MKVYPKYKYQLLCVVIFLAFTSCKKLVDIDAPVTGVSNDNAYNNNGTATAVLTGIYGYMSAQNSVFTGMRGVSIMSGLSADEWTLFSGVTDASMVAYYKNALTSSSTIRSAWPQLYNLIYNCNSAIEGLNTSSLLTPNVKKQLLGEAKFLRGFFYFYLVNMFGDVPLVMGTDYKVTSLLPKAAKTDVYGQIVKDLVEAKDLLSDEFLDGSLEKYSANIERARPTKWSAIALLARVYLYKGDYLNAESEATILINNTSLFSLVNLNTAFLKASMGNKEAIWQLQPVTTGHNTEDGWIFTLPINGPNGSTSANSGHPVYLNQLLLNSFEPNDQRRVIGNWIKSVTRNGITYFYPFKYKSATLNSAVNEYLSVLRLAEQFLIRSEARAKQNNLSGAIADIDMIRQRAGLPLISITNPGISQSALLTAILHERQVELFTELGHRWFDLKRTGNIDAAMSITTPLKSNGTTQWQSYQQLYPVPTLDIDRNPNLIQNSGY